MSSSSNEELKSPRHFTYAFVPEFGISPVSNLSANLCSNLHIRRNLVFGSNENTPLKTETDENATKIFSSPTSRKHEEGSPGTEDSPIAKSRLSFNRRFSHNSSKVTMTTNKENTICRRSFSMDFPPMYRADEISPSKFGIVKQMSRERFPLEDQDPNSQDSGYSNGSSIFSEDSKSSTSFRFAQPSGVAPRRTYTAEFSPGRDSTSPISKRHAGSPRRRQPLVNRMFTDSMSSDFSDDGFGDNIMLPPDETLLMERDENAQLPPGFSSLLSGTICNLSKINESPNLIAEDGSFLQTNLRQSLIENITPKKVSVRASVAESDFNELMILEKDAVKRTAMDTECGFSIKRRKSSPKLKLYSEKKVSFGRSWSMSIPATAPISSTRGTLFNYGFKKLQRSFSETEASIKNAVQRAMSNPELIGDYSKSFVLPSKMAQCGNTRMAYLSCDTLAKLMKGEYEDIVGSFTIVDCRFPYEFEGGHIRGATNIYTEAQMSEEFKENKCIRKLEKSGCTSKRDILIFHCEFSSKRGPKMVKYVRNEDRNRNFNQYPKLDYPEIYLLQGGYANFYKLHKDLCDPCGYRPMVNSNH